MKISLKIFVLASLSVFFTENAVFNSDIVYAAAASAALDEIELTHLSFIREEEKLARDVYITLYERFKNIKTPFSRIDDSEQRHTDAVAGMLHKYAEDDPNTDDTVGVYTGEYGAYLTEKYVALIDVDTPYPEHPLNYTDNPLLNALYHGAFIEELDMNDIAYCPYIIMDNMGGIDEEIGCGLEYTDERPVKRLYNNLLDGSENHLRAYVYAIEQIIGEGEYKAQYLTQEEVDEILGR